MCTFVYATIDKGANTTGLKQVFAKHDRAMHLMKDDELVRQVPEDQVLIFTTMTHCDCHVPLGRLEWHQKSEQRREHHDERLIKRHLKDGWSKSKIERWLSERTAAGARIKSENLPGVTLAQWIALIDDVLNSGITKHFGLMHYMHGDRKAGEEITLTLRRVNRRDVTEEMLHALLEYEILLIDA